MMENKVEKMDHLIQGILTYSKLTEAIVKENVDTHEIVESIIDNTHA
jgi:signal transduction histidine kinase